MDTWSMQNRVLRSQSRVGFFPLLGDFLNGEGVRPQAQGWLKTTSEKKPWSTEIRIRDNRIIYKRLRTVLDICRIYSILLYFMEQCSTMGFLFFLSLCHGKSWAEGRADWRSISSLFFSLPTLPFLFLFFFPSNILLLLGFVLYQYNKDSELLNQRWLFQKRGQTLAQVFSSATEGRGVVVWIL